MGNFFTSTQILNNEILDSKKFINEFCEKMAEEGYVTCNNDESELSYILRFANNCKWVTITSEAYEQGNEKSQKDTGRIAKMLKTSCVNTTVIDSDCAIMDLYDKNGKKADTIIMGRADDYFGDDIPSPSEKKWKPFLCSGSTWEQFEKVRKEEYVVVEEGLARLAPLIGIDACNITFAAEDAKEDDEAAFFLDFKKTAVITMSQNGNVVEKAPKKLTLKTAFKQIFGEALEPYGFKAIKGKYPYIVRVVNNEILHIVTYHETSSRWPADKAFEILSGVATIYRKRISLDKSPKQNYIWFNNLIKFYSSFTHDKNQEIIQKLYKFCYSSNNQESMITILKDGVESFTKYALPVLDKVIDIDSCMDYLNEFQMPRNSNMCTKIWSYYPDEDEAFLNVLSDRIKNKRPDFLKNFFKDAELHNYIMNEIEKRKTENTEIIKTLNLIN